MRKLSAIFFLVTYLSINTEVHQLLRLPILVAHFKEHKTMKPGITFLEYFLLHYTSGNDHNHNHEDLPFRQKHCEAIHIAFAVVPDLTPTEFSTYSFSSRSKIAYEPRLHYAWISASIWQPPRHLS